MEWLHGQLVDPRTNIKLLIVEEQAVLRQGLLAIASSIPEVATPPAALSGVPARDESSDVDITLITTWTLASAERKDISTEHLQPMIVIVPTSEPEQLAMATRRRASGYILQSELTPTSLRTALLQVLGGNLAVSDEIAAHLLDRVREDHHAPRPRRVHLSSRESEVLALLVAGASNKAIAAELHISVHAVKRHVSNLLTRFNSPNRVHLVSLVLRSEMAPPGSGRHRHHGVLSRDVPGA